MEHLQGFCLENCSRYSKFSKCFVVITHVLHTKPANKNTISQSVRSEKRRRGRKTKPELAKPQIPNAIRGFRSLLTLDSGFWEELKREDSAQRTDAGKNIQAIACECLYEVFRQWGLTFPALCAEDSGIDGEEKLCWIPAVQKVKS